MRLLLDAMFSRKLAYQLRQRGHDVVAADERGDLARLPDPDIFALAQTEQRAVVTENVPDFLELDSLYRAQRLDHYGLILTSAHRFPRTRAALGRLLHALDAFLRAQPTEPRATGLVHWLR